MTQEIGLSVVRGTTQSSPYIAPADTTNIGMLGRFQRGVPNKAVRISSPEQAKKLLGVPGARKNGAQCLGMYAILRIFENSLPYSPTLYVVKQDEGDTAAVSNAMAVDSLGLVSNWGTPRGSRGFQYKLEKTSSVYTLTVNNSYLTNVSSEFTSTGASGAIVLPTVGTNVKAGTVKVTNGVEVFSDNGSGVLTGNLGGTGSVVYTTGVATVTFNTVTANGVKITATAKKPQAATATETYSIPVADLHKTAEIINSSQIVRAEFVPSGVTDLVVVSTLTDASESQGTAFAKLTSTVGVNSTFKVYAGQKGSRDPGAWANNYEVRFYSVPNKPSERTVEVFGLVGTQELTSLEVIPGLTAGNWVNKINDPSSGSEYITIEITAPVTSDSESFPDPQILTLSGGIDASTATEAAALNLSTVNVGLRALDSEPVNMILISDYQNPSVDLAIDNYVLSYKTSGMGISGLPKLKSVSDVDAYVDPNGVSYRRTLKVRGKMARYKAWETVDQYINNKVSGRIEIPAYFAATGSAYVRKMLAGSGYPSEAPAGPSAVINGAYAIDVMTYNAADLAFLTHDLGINAIMYMPRVGFIPRTSRTNSTSNEEIDIHKLRSDNYLIESLQGSLGWLEQMPNIPDTQKTLVNAIRSFSLGLYNKGFFDKSVPFEEAVVIQCDENNNTGAIKAARRLVCDYVVKYPDIIESALISINRSAGIITVTN